MSDIKQPQDHLAKSEPFDWTAPDGRTVRLTPFDRIPSGVFRKARALDEMDMTFALIEAGTDEDGLEVIDDLPLGDLDQLFTAWSAGGGADLPKSS